MSQEWMEKIQDEHMKQLGCGATMKGAEHTLIALDIYRFVSETRPETDYRVLSSALWLAMQMVSSPESAASTVRQALVFSDK